MEMVNWSQKMAIKLLQDNSLMENTRYATYKSKATKFIMRDIGGMESSMVCTRYWENGKEFYKGNWKNSKFHGQGYYRFEDGSSIDGEWLMVQ